MPMNHHYASVEPTRAEVDARIGPAIVEFGAPWCPHCQNAQPLLEQAMFEHPTVHHTKVEDGKTCMLGRTFRVKLWPTIIFLKDGVEVTRLVRPENAELILKALELIDLGGLK